MSLLTGASRIVVLAFYSLLQKEQNAVSMQAVAPDAGGVAGRELTICKLSTLWSPRLLLGSRREKL